MPTTKEAEEKCYFESEAYAPTLKQDGTNAKDLMKNMRGLMEAVIENATGQMTMTDLYMITEHTDRCDHCKALFGKLARKKQ